MWYTTRPTQQKNTGLLGGEDEHQVHSWLVPTLDQIPVLATFEGAKRLFALSSHSMRALMRLNNEPCGQFWSPRGACA